MVLKKKIGIIACSCEEVVGGTITRVAARIVVEKLSPDNTVNLEHLSRLSKIEKDDLEKISNFIKDQLSENNSENNYIL